MFYIGAFIYLMVLCSIPLVASLCDDIYDCTALKYILGFIAISIIMYCILYAIRLTTGSSIGEPEIIRMFLLSEFGSMFTVVSFYMFNSILDDSIE